MLEAFSSVKPNVQTSRNIKTTPTVTLRLIMLLFFLNEYFITNTTQTHFFILKKFYILLHLYTMMTQLLVIIYLFYLWLALCLWNTTASTNCTISVNIFYAIWNRQKSTKKKEIIDEKLNSRDTSVPFKIEPKNETCVKNVWMSTLMHLILSRLSWNNIAHIYIYECGKKIKKTHISIISSNMCKNCVKYFWYARGLCSLSRKIAA